MGDSKKVTNNFKDEICIAEMVKERVTEVMAGYGRWGKKTGVKRVGGRVGDGGATGDKIKKPFNKKDEDRNCLRCKVCKSIRHIKESCKDKNKENKREPTFWGPLQVWPTVYILYIGINLAIIMKQYGANASQMCLAVKCKY